jgi:hypothetical protein
MERLSTKLSTLWLFATLNYLYCDVVTLMDPSVLRGFLAGNVGGMTVSQGFLLAGGALVEIPIAMVLLSRMLPPFANRWANIGAAAFMTVVQAASLLAKTPAPYYLFFSTIEIATTLTIVWLAWHHAPARRQAAARGLLPSQPGS